MSALLELDAGGPLDTDLFPGGFGRELDEESRSRVCQQHLQVAGLVGGEFDADSIEDERGHAVTVALEDELRERLGVEVDA